MPFLSTYIFMLLCYFVTFFRCYISRFQCPSPALSMRLFLRHRLSSIFTEALNTLCPFRARSLIRSPVLNSSRSSASSEPAAKDLYMNLAKSMRGGKSEHDL